jgi:hypothetical protein
MARIRTIKPEFFTSEDIVGLSPLARLLYIAIWCESDKEGRLNWKPLTFKLRYFPADNCDINALCEEIVSIGLVKLYGEGFAVIPSFKVHQHINPRESESQLPEPTEIPTRKPRVTTRQAPVADAQGGREGKGREGDKRVKPRSTTIPDDFAISERVSRWANEKGFTNLEPQFDAFVSYAKRKGATYVDWDEALMTAIRDDWAKVRGKSGGDDPYGLRGAI